MRFKQLLPLPLALAVASPLAGDDRTITVFGQQVSVRPGDAPQDYFGLKTQESVIHIAQWQRWRLRPANDAWRANEAWAEPWNGPSESNPGYLNPAANSLPLFLVAPMAFDAGVQVLQVCVDVLDASGLEDVSLFVGAYESGGRDDGPVWVDLESVATAGFPGYVRLCATVDPVLTIRTTADIDGDGHAHTAQYSVRALTIGDFACFPVGCPEGPFSQTAIGPAVITWRRTISPAPASPTFGDVSPGSPFYRFVEALAASGVATGCGAGNFCPDDPLTRGQMAVFLAAALGLYWPN